MCISCDQKLLFYTYRSKKAWSNVFIAAVSIGAEHFKWLTCKSIGKWLSKRKHIHTVEYYATAKNNAVVICILKW